MTLAVLTAQGAGYYGYTMRLASSIAPHVPHLRRFARLLTGTQSAGDSAVARVLEAIAASEEGIGVFDTLKAVAKLVLQDLTKST